VGRQGPRYVPLLGDPRLNTMTRPSKSKHVQLLWGVSASTFLTLCIAWGPRRACFVIAVAFILWAWVAACGRWPGVSIFTSGFLTGLVGGLFGYRGGYYQSYYRPRRRRR
jgi:hypothetical protein